MYRFVFGGDSPYAAEDHVGNSGGERGSRRQFALAYVALHKLVSCHGKGLPRHLAQVLVAA